MFPYSEFSDFQGTEVLYILPDGTLLTKACLKVCGVNKNQSVHLWNHIFQILSGMGIYSPHSHFLRQTEAVVQYLILFANGTAVARTSVQNSNKLWHIGSALIGFTAQ
jgi:hypothetical protein